MSTSSHASLTKEQLLVKVAALEQANDELRDFILAQTSQEAKIADLFSRAYLVLSTRAEDPDCHTLSREMENFLGVHS